MIVSHGRRIDTVTAMRSKLLTIVEPWRGSVQSIFDGRLMANQNGRAFVGQQPPLPAGSVGFWVSQYPLTASRVPEVQGRRYWFPEGEPVTSVKYVGMEPQVAVIPVGALVRFSLARWAAFPPGSEERCYLQVSGCFA